MIRLYILVRRDLLHLSICSQLIFVDTEKNFQSTLTGYDDNTVYMGRLLRVVGDPLRRILQFDDLASFVEHTLLYQSIDLEFYSNSK